MHVLRSLGIYNLTEQFPPIYCSLDVIDFSSQIPSQNDYFQERKTIFLKIIPRTSLFCNFEFKCTQHPL